MGKSERWVGELDAVHHLAIWRNVFFSASFDLLQTRLRSAREISYHVNGKLSMSCDQTQGQVR